MSYKGQRFSKGQIRLADKAPSVELLTMQAKLRFLSTTFLLLILGLILPTRLAFAAAQSTENQS